MDGPGRIAWGTRSDTSSKAQPLLQNVLVMLVCFFYWLQRRLVFTYFVSLTINLQCIQLLHDCVPQPSACYSTMRVSPNPVGVFGAVSGCGTDSAHFGSSNIHYCNLWITQYDIVELRNVACQEHIVLQNATVPKQCTLMSHKTGGLQPRNGDHMAQ